MIVANVALIQTATVYAGGAGWSDSLVDGAWLGVEGKEMPGILLLGGKGVVLGEK